MNHEVMECAEIEAQDRALTTPSFEEIDESDGEVKVFRLGAFRDDDCLTRTGMCQIFKCSERTLFRMVDRFEIPPPISLAGRSAWLIGGLKSWLANTARQREAEALKEAKRLNLLAP